MFQAVVQVGGSDLARAGAPSLLLALAIATKQLGL